MKTLLTTAVSPLIVVAAWVGGVPRNPRAPPRLASCA
jgi:hypothetical protein